MLRKIGRNIVNFQKIEAMLKALNAQLSISGPLTEFSALAAKAKAAVAKQPMGRLAEAFVQSVFSAAPSRTGSVATERTAVSFSFQIEADGSVAKERKRALRRVVVERNKLVHKWLAEFDPNSLESCARLSTVLDEQHKTVLPEFETLKGIFQTFRELLGEHQRYIASDDFLRDLQQAEVAKRE